MNKLERLKLPRNFKRPASLLGKKRLLRSFFCCSSNNSQSLNTKVRSTMLCLCGFELYSGWVPLKNVGLTHTHFQYNSRKLVNVVKVRFTMMYSSRKLNNNKKVITTACNFWGQIACSFQVYGHTNHFCAKSTRKTLFRISRFFSPDQHWRHKLFFPTIFPTALRR